MAHKDIVTIQGRSEICLNLDGSVGIGAQNEVGDVMLIQAFLKYTFNQTTALIGEIPEVPAVTGIYDPTTSQAISQYCRGRIGGLLGYNGRIDPGNYKGRNIKNPRGRLMIITRMHLDARAMQPSWGSTDYIADMLRFDPMLSLHLKRGFLDGLAVMSTLTAKLTKSR